MSKQNSWLENNWQVLLIVGLIALIVVPMALSYWTAPTTFEANRESGQEIAEESMDADKAIQEYRWFKEQWYDIKAAREQLDNYQAQEERFHETWPDGEWKESRDARTRHGRIHDRITGQRNQISNLVSAYNARRADATRAIFTCGLPYNIDEKLFIADASGVEYTSQEAKATTPPDDPTECEFAQNPAESGASDTS